VTGGLKRLVPLLEPIYEGLLERNARSTYRQADETRWLVFVEQEGKHGYRWWLWAFLGEDTVVFRIAPTRSHEVPEQHYPQDVRAFLMVDRYSAYQAMVQVKLGVVILAFCWAHVRRDFVEVGKGWPELADGALSWLRRIREIYRLNRQRRKHWNVNPRRWLTWYLESCAVAGSKPPADIESFLPWNLSDERRSQLANRVSLVEPIDSS